MSGILDWTPMHTSELFWRQNIDRFEEKDFQVLRVLLKLLEASREVRSGLLQPRGCPRRTRMRAGRRCVRARIRWRACPPARGPRRAHLPPGLLPEATRPTPTPLPPPP